MDLDEDVVIVCVLTVAGDMEACGSDAITTGFFLGVADYMHLMMLNLAIYCFHYQNKISEIMFMSFYKDKRNYSYMYYKYLFLSISKMLTDSLRLSISP